MATYTGWTRGGRPIYKIGDTYYVLLSKHKTKRTAEEMDRKRDTADLTQKVGMWYMRFNRIPKTETERMRTFARVKEQRR